MFGAHPTQWARRAAALCAAAFATLAFALPGNAQAAYPDKPIRLIVPWAPGGATDAIGRILAQALDQQLHTNVIVDNLAGAGGNIGTASFTRDAADGYSLIMLTSSTNAANPYLYKHLGFEPVASFAPVAFVASIPNVLEVPKNSPFTSVQQLIDFARAHPGKLNYGSAGVGSSQHLADSQLASVTKINLTHIPFKGSGPATSALLAGQVDLMMDTGSLAQVQSGVLRALAVASPQRLPALPNVPTFDELGIHGMYASAWYGVAAPKGTPADIVKTLNQAISQVLADPHVRALLTNMGAQLQPPTTPAQFQQFMESELLRYKTIVEQSGAKPV